MPAACRVRAQAERQRPCGGRAGAPGARAPGGWTGCSGRTATTRSRSRDHPRSCRAAASRRPASGSRLALPSGTLQGSRYTLNAPAAELCL